MKFDRSDQKFDKFFLKNTTCRLKLRTDSLGSFKKLCRVTISIPASRQRASRSSTVYVNLEHFLSKRTKITRILEANRYENFFSLLKNGYTSPAKLLHDFNTSRVVNSS